MAYGPEMSDLVYVGMVGILDPPRPGIKESLQTLMEGGVSVKMVTGDAEATARTIGRNSYSNTLKCTVSYSLSSCKILN